MSDKALNSFQKCIIFRILSKAAFAQYKEESSQKINILRFKW